MRAVGPLLVQNAAEHPEFYRHPALALGLGRYLGVPIFDPQGRVIGTLCFVDDRTGETLGERDIRFLSLLAMRVSAEMERERMVQARVEEHRRATEDMARLNARLEASAEEKRRFVAMVLHDLRHPLTSLRTLLYLARREEDAEQRQTCLEAMEERIGALTLLLNDLTDYSAIEAGRPQLHVGPVEVCALVRDCVASFAPAVPNESLRLEWEIDPTLGRVLTDGGKLTHILLNLLSNAIKYTPCGMVRLRARREGRDRWSLTVEDTGPGMTTDEQAQACEEYCRAGPGASGESPGLGLGLAIVKQFAGALQADLSLSGAPGQGMRVHLRFPRRLKT